MQRERFGRWRVYAPSLSSFLFFIVMMTYGNYLHRSMLCCTEWKRWSPGSIVPDALCKQPAGFAFFSFYFLLFFPPPPSFPSWGTSGISYTSVEGSVAICEQPRPLAPSRPLYRELGKCFVFFFFFFFAEGGGGRCAEQSQRDSGLLSLQFLVFPGEQTLLHARTGERGAPSLAL